METLKLKDDAKGIKTAAELLKKGGIVAIPTETVYGLAASAFDDEAIKKVFIAKGRPQDNPLIVHIADFDNIENIVGDFPEKAKELARRFWPGPLTMVLPKSKRIAESVSGGLDTVAVRMPENEVAREIIRESGLPLAAPSANLSGSPSPTKSEDVIADLDGRIDAVVCSGHSDVGVESTVVTLVTNPPRLLRPGRVTAEELREIIPDLLIDKAVLSGLEKSEKAASPGMKYKHYSPKTEVYLVEAESAAFCRFVNSKEDSAAICFSEDAPKINRKTLSIGASDNEEEQARLIFERLRESDALGVKTVYVHAPKKSGIGLAVYNRLIRAAGFKVIKPKFIVGLTGPTGSGKTTACRIAEDNGFYVVNCDKTARKATENEECLSQLCSVFGEDIIKSDGTLDRAALAEKAFATPEKTELLNKTIFPFITKLIETEINSSDRGKILLDAPTLFESGADSLCDAIIVVTADLDLRLHRIMKRDSIGREAAMLRINAGKTDDFYKTKVEHIIYNNGDEESFISEFQKIIDLVGGKDHE